MIHDQHELQRIRSLAIPPAWLDVWICPSASGYLQATGRDARGRKQYVYHPRWRWARDESKFGRMVAFGQALPALRKQIERDLRAPDLSRRQVLATVVRLLDRTLIRVGSEEYARENHSFGLTTLRNEHVNAAGPALRFRFRAKSGKECCLTVNDRRAVRVVRRCRKLPGRVLFEYVDGARQPHSLASSDVNAYLHENMGPEFTAKDFRTWGGSVAALERLLQLGPAPSAAAAKQNVVAAVRHAAEQLLNTPAICRASYIHPALLRAYAAGDLPHLAEPAPGEEMPAGISEAEGRLLRVLQRTGNGRKTARRQNRT